MATARAQEWLKTNWTEGEAGNCLTLGLRAGQELTLFGPFYLSGHGREDGAAWILLGGEATS